MAIYSVGITADANLDSLNPDLNVGTAQTLSVQYSFPEAKSEHIFTIAYADFSAAPGLTSVDQITAAVTRVYVSALVNNPNLGIRWKPVHDNKYDLWTEGFVTWNDYDDGLSWTAAGGDFDTDADHWGDIEYPNATGFLEWDCLKVVQDAFSTRSSIFSAILSPVDYEEETSNAVTFASKNNATSAWRPELNITYTIEGEGKSGGYVIQF